MFVNNTGANVNSIIISYDGEQWRNGGSNNADSLAFSYSVGGTDISTGTFTNASSLNFSSKQTSATPAALNGNASADRGVVTATLSNLNWAPGQQLVIRWSENSPAGTSGGPDGLAVDNFVLGTSPTTVYVGSGFTQDPGTSVNVPGGTATIGYNAFSTIAQAQSVIGSTGTILVTSGIYTSGGSLTPSQTLAIADAAAATFAASVTLGAGGILHYEGPDPASLSFASEASSSAASAESRRRTGRGHAHHQRVGHRRLRSHQDRHGPGAVRHQQRPQCDDGHHRQRRHPRRRQHHAFEEPDHDDLGRRGRRIFRHDQHDGGRQP